MAVDEFAAFSCPPARRATGSACLAILASTGMRLKHGADTEPSTLNRIDSQLFLLSWKPSHCLSSFCRISWSSSLDPGSTLRSAVSSLERLMDQDFDMNLNTPARSTTFLTWNLTAAERESYEGCAHQDLRRPSAFFTGHCTCRRVPDSARGIENAGNAVGKGMVQNAALEGNRALQVPLLAGRLCPVSAQASRPKKRQQFVTNLHPSRREVDSRHPDGEPEHLVFQVECALSLRVNQ